MTFTSAPKDPHTDIQRTHWIYRVFPQKAHPYLSLMRLDRPIGTWLLLLPAWWSLASVTAPLWLYILFAAGAVIMRGAGCIINDLWDKDFDKAVERTRSRPLASGAITPRQAIIFLAALLTAGLLILLQLAPTAILLGFLSLIPVILYPLAKRVTWYPQAVLGLTFNFGALMGAASITNTLTLPAVLMYAAGFFWTLGYDTIYAHQDINDDALIGVKSTARKFGSKSPLFISLFYATSALLLFITGISAHMGGIFFVFWGLAALHLTGQIYRWNPDNAADCLQKFRSNRDFGLIICAAFWADLIT